MLQEFPYQINDYELDKSQVSITFYEMSILCQVIN